jgi:hypothetical protein
MKQVSQLDQDGYFVGVTTADPSPLEPDVYLIPGGAVDASAPTIPEGKRARWVDGNWVFEDIPPEKPKQPYPSWTYDEDTNEWVPPVAKPDGDAEWNENSQEWTPGPEVSAREVRSERDHLLADSDWAVLPDAPVANGQAWKDYRQALRDVPQQVGFPTEIDWPVKPE